MKKTVPLTENPLFYFSVFVVLMVLAKTFLTLKDRAYEKEINLPVVEVSLWNIEWKNELNTESLIGQTGKGTLLIQHDYINKQTILILNPESNALLGFKIADNNSHSFIIRPNKEPEPYRNIVANNVAFGYPFDVQAVLSGIKWRDNVYDVHTAALTEKDGGVYLEEGGLVFYRPHEKNTSNNNGLHFPLMFVMKSVDRKFKITFHLSKYQVFTRKNLPSYYTPF